MAVPWHLSYYTFWIQGGPTLVEEGSRWIQSPHCEVMQIWRGYSDYTHNTRLWPWQACSSPRVVPFGTAPDRTWLRLECDRRVNVTNLWNSKMSIRIPGKPRWKETHFAVRIFVRSKATDIQQTQWKEVITHVLNMRTCNELTIWCKQRMVRTKVIIFVWLQKMS